MAVAKIPEYGGYDNDFIGTISERFVCNICTKVLRNPRLTECCGQHFCESCLTHWFKTQKAKTCPHCREKNFVHIQNKALKREISQLKVHCALRQDGCTWQGELGDLQAHLDSDTGCGFVVLECPNKCITEIFTMQRCESCMRLHVPRLHKTKSTLKRKDMAKHLSSECYLRKYKCEHCNFEDTYETITGKGNSVRKMFMRGPSHDPYIIGSHYSECPMIPVDCPNMCGAKRIKRKDVPSHQDKCPLEKLDCPNQCKEHYRWGIATSKINRKDLHEHLRTRCYLRKYTCVHCGHSDRYQAITGKGGPRPVNAFHFQTCPDFPLECPNKCGVVKIQRKNMTTHREQCPLEPVQCPFQEAGCQTRLVRRDLDNHMATQTQQHLLLAFQKTQTENTDLRKRCDDLSNKNAHLEEQCDNLRKDLAELKHELRLY